MLVSILRQGSYLVASVHTALDDTEMVRFRNDLVDIDARATHRAIGRVTGTVGASGYVRTFDSFGEEALSPKVDQHVFSAFSYQEAAWAHVTLQFGGRFDRASRCQPTH